MRLVMMTLEAAENNWLKLKRSESHSRINFMI